MKLAGLQKKYFFFLCLFSFVFVAFTAVTLSLSSSGRKPSVRDYLTPLISISRPKNLPQNPILKSDSSDFPVVSARAVLAIDLDSMVPLYEKNADATCLPASTTKIVTALVAMDHYSDDVALEVDGLKVPGQNMGLVQGEKILAGSLLDGLLIYSANDAAEVLAANYCAPRSPTGEVGSCGRPAFIEAMNLKVKEYRLQNTRFVNPTGFDNSYHYSTARDLIRISIEAMKNPRFSRIVSQKEKYVADLDGNIIHKLKNTNELLGKVPGVLGVKTGWTENARENLVTYLERDGRKIMITVLGSQDRFGETKEIINWIFANYQWQEVGI